MSLRSDGAYRCDRCGRDVGNGSVLEAAVVSDTADGGLTHRVLHFCRQPSKGAPHGCAAHLLSRSNTTDYAKENARERRAG